MLDTHSYIAESENLIRTRGLPKPVKSEKVQKLHGIFSYLKIVQESTALNTAKTIREVNEEDSSDDSLSDASQSAQTRLAWLEDDEQEEEDVEEDSMFISIYSMPTALLSLISQTSSLYNQLQVSGLTPELARRCQIIEDRIFKWKAPKTLSIPEDWESASFQLRQTKASNESLCAAHMVAATSSALIVHFQRQIRKTDPRVLQHYVLASAKHLLAHEHMKDTHHIISGSFPWPGFIVGCEAHDGTARHKIDAYLRIIRKYNMGSLVEMENVIHEVWRRQDLDLKNRCWEDVLNDWGTRIVLT
jgi:arginine metabolism regulation protein II